MRATVFSSWPYLYYHKKKVHEMNIESKKYDNEMKNKEKNEAEKAKKYLFCPRIYRKPTMEEHYRKNRHEYFAWVECGLQKIVRYVKLVFHSYFVWITQGKVDFLQVLCFKINQILSSKRTNYML